MRRVVGYLVIAILVATLMTSATALVKESVLAQIPGDRQGSRASATVSGFPLPYGTVLLCCGISDGIPLNGTYYFHPANLAVDFTIWLAISLAVALTFSSMTLALALAAGLGLTLLTLLTPPLGIVMPGYGTETSVLRPMGFPYEYLTYYAGGLPAAYVSGYDFNLFAALADYALWTGVAAALIGLTVTIFRGACQIARLRAWQRS